MAAPCRRACLPYLFHLAQDNLDFRLPEIEALLALRGKRFSPWTNFKEKCPFWCLEDLTEDDVCCVMARSVCAKSAFELWGHGRNHNELRTSLLSYPVEKMLPFLRKDSTYRINVYTFNKSLDFTERVKRIDAMDYLPFEGLVSLKNPQHVFCLLEDYGTDPNNIPQHPYYIYFGRWIADGQRELIRSHSVKKRHFIGNTSMDAGLSFIMANHAKVKEHDLVFDPFVGTGSLLVACSHFGAYVCGSDIDYNTIHGKGRSSRKDQKWRGPDENIRANLRQYGSEKLYVDVMVSDASKPVWRENALFDAIITDPPYGIRESTRRTGSQRESAKAVECVYAESHVPVSQSYHMSQILADMLNFSAHRLVMGGRLVYWLPVYRPEYCEEMVPLHPCLRLISNCEQILSSHTARRLITVEKVREPEELDSLAHVSDSCFSAYQGHNAFREKYFSGLNKRLHKENKSD
ncbi:tRNA (guanine(10)-N2)-methyltransferase homolog isoform X1 [Syngnathus acus]|uniref:tRNA (guanine(10)-N2)-methyltransferase homolog isoform X1 n=3 Tax=Syngnathus acus TaxID=161584 RepID=UPI0018862E0F|nr:tRNA (guanine(10)-N2)-methyltransferase homolog isoform X1 [Syngnathus acus]XP_037128842.1 tRNA (guanine(10)-N2)-methyltransferase homolog isoform X1 [Syngnathus acus]